MLIEAHSRMHVSSSYPQLERNIMDLNRADAKLIRDEERREVLAKFGMANSEPLAVGTEAEVYDRDDGTLLKLYADAGRLGHLRTLQRLYETIDASHAAI